MGLLLRVAPEVAHAASDFPAACLIALREGGWRQDLVNDRVRRMVRLRFRVGDYVFYTFVRGGRRRCVRLSRWGLINCVICAPFMGGNSNETSFFKDAHLNVFIFLCRLKVLSA